MFKFLIIAFIPTFAFAATEGIKIPIPLEGNEDSDDPSFYCTRVPSQNPTNTAYAIFPTPFSEYKLQPDNSFMLGRRRVLATKIFRIAKQVYGDAVDLDSTVIADGKRRKIRKLAAVLAAMYEDAEQTGNELKIIDNRLYLLRKAFKNVPED